MSASSSANPNLEHPLAILGRAIEAGSFRPPSQASPAHATATHAASGGRSADLSRRSSASSAGFGPDRSQLPALRAAVAQALSPHRPAANHQYRPAGNMSQSPTIAGSTRPRTGIMTGATVYGQQGSAVASRSPGINVGGHTPFVQDAVARRSLSASSHKRATLACRRTWPPLARIRLEDKTLSPLLAQDDIIEHSARY